MDELSGRGLGSGLGLGRVDQGSSFTTCSGLESVCARARASRTGRGGVVLLLLLLMMMMMRRIIDAEFDAMLVLLLALLHGRARVGCQD